MTAATQIEKTFREEHDRVLAALIIQFEDFDLAEDVLQDALGGRLHSRESNEGAILFPEYAVDSWGWSLLINTGLFDPNKKLPIL